MDNPLFDAECVRLTPDGMIRFFRREGNRFYRVHRLRVPPNADAETISSLVEIIQNYVECVDVPATAENAAEVTKSACQWLIKTSENRGSQ